MAELCGRELTGNFAWNCDFHVNSGIFYMPQICDVGPMALLPFRRKACWGFFRPEKSWRLRPGLNPRTWVLEGSTLPLDHRSHPERLLLVYYKLWTCLCALCHSVHLWWHKEMKEGNSFLLMWNSLSYFVTLICQILPNSGLHTGSVYLLRVIIIFTYIFFGTPPVFQSYHRCVPLCSCSSVCQKMRYYELVTCWETEITSLVSCGKESGVFQC